MSSFVVYEPFYEFDRLFDGAFARVPRAVSHGAAEGTNDNAVRALKPRMDVHENKEQNLVTVTLELPGMKKEDVQIDVQNNRLTVAGKTKISSEHEEKGYAVRERKYGKFSRTLKLPEGIKDSEVSATLDNGVLALTFPSTTPEQLPKKITIA